MLLTYRCVLAALCCICPVLQAVAADPDQDPEAAEEASLARQLSNPVAALISVPVQFNYDRGIGVGRNGHRVTMNIQPVVPFSLNNEWNLISRTILPVVSQSDIAFGSGNQFGLGDTVQSFFFSPKNPTSSGWIWGAGPVLLLPTGTDRLLSTRKWSAGPTAVGLRQSGPWTYGMLFNHLWSFAGDSNRNDVNSSLLQPFVSYTTRSAITYSFNTESVYDWQTKRWTSPVNFNISKVTRLNRQLVSIGVGLRYWAASPDSGPHGWGVRTTLTFLFPR